MKNNKRNNRLNELEKEAIRHSILYYKPFYEKGKKVIYYCDYGWHQGIINNRNKAQSCINKSCKYLYRFEID